MAQRGRPPTRRSDRKTANMKIPLTAEEKGAIMLAAESDDTKPVTWARNILIRAARRKTR